MHPSLFTCIHLYSPLATSLLLDLPWFAWICQDLANTGKSRQIQANQGKSRQIQANPDKASNRLVDTVRYRKIHADKAVTELFFNIWFNHLTKFLKLTEDLNYLVFANPGKSRHSQQQAGGYSQIQADTDWHADKAVTDFFKNLVQSSVKFCKADWKSQLFVCICQ